ncbi:hypothetical protein [Arenibacter certesii]|uniref:UvrD-like helicase C-terminal domain-containing protein n=1 Tax=Arenibacter certesii TaxID=228955 RepID=A0A918MRW2_9FLAO|nr:hypothetical protein [Arenibacter certesii]GGW49619.1 hypothetical protein GCM10007383_36860 [Arenibacter certesii]
MIFQENKLFLDFFNSLENEAGKNPNLNKYILYKGTSAIDTGNIRKLIPEKSVYIDKSLTISLSGVQKKIDSLSELKSVTKNKLYVACSRANNNLYLISEEKIKQYIN